MKAPESLVGTRMAASASPGREREFGSVSGRLRGDVLSGALAFTEERRDPFDVGAREHPHAGAFYLLAVDGSGLGEAGDRGPAAPEDYARLTDGDEGRDVFARVRLGHRGQGIGGVVAEWPVGFAQTGNHCSTCSLMLLHGNIEGTLEVDAEETEMTILTTALQFPTVATDENLDKAETQIVNVPLVLADGHEVQIGSELVCRWPTSSALPVVVLGIEDPDPDDDDTVYVHLRTAWSDHEFWMFSEWLHYEGPHDRRAWHDANDGCCECYRCLPDY